MRTSMGRRVVRMLVIVGLAAAMLVPVLASAGSWTVTRLAGNDRFTTAVEVSQEMYPTGADRVYVAYGYGFPDALAAGGGLPGPVLLTRQTSIPGTVLTEIKRLAPSEVFIVGGPAVIDPAVATQLTGAAPPTTTSTSTTTTTIPAPTDRDALEALYDATDGDNWGANTGWLGAGDICGWYGIICTNGNVTELSLTSNQLTGTIPIELGNLTGLTSLNLNDNQLTGTIPIELGNLTGLTGLSLSANQLTGTIPIELGNLTDLAVLFLNDNQLTGTIPTKLGNLTDLTVLGLSDNALTGTVPAEVGDLDSLRLLLLKNNDLSGELPDALLDLQDTVLVLTLSGQSGCLTTVNHSLAAWLDSLDANWNDGC